MLKDRLKEIEKLHPRLIDLGLERILSLLNNLGNPQEKCAPIIHIAGTNGKGSTLAFCESLLKSAGYKTQKFTSPHLVRFNERIRLADGDISDKDLLSMLNKVEAANNGEAISLFEFTTALGFLAFSRDSADYLLLETGLGGRFDATNIIKKPAITIITQISLDHQNFLGDSLMEITSEKAGIIKPNCPVIIAKQQNNAILSLLKNKAKERNAACFIQDEDWRVVADNKGMVYENKKAESIIKLPFPNLIGEYQIDNAGLALAAMDILNIPNVNHKKGITSAKWKARLEKISESPEIWLDGGHNPAAAKILAKQAKKWQETEPKKELIVIIGMMNTKDPKSFLEPLAPYIKYLYSIPLSSSPNYHNPEYIQEVAQSLNIKSMQSGSMIDIMSMFNNTHRILICGSLYLAKEAYEMVELNYFTKK